MALRRMKASIDVVQAAEIRIRNAFESGLPIYLSFSGGKDSLCMADIIYRLIREDQINPEQLTVIFIDEEAIFPCIERIVREWRERLHRRGKRAPGFRA